MSPPRLSMSTAAARETDVRFRRTHRLVLVCVGFRHNYNDNAAILTEISSTNVLRRLRADGR